MSEADKYCRICLKIYPNISSIYQIHESKYVPAVIYNISGIKISQRIEPRACICQRCKEAVVDAYDIILRCQESEEFLISQQKEGDDTAALKESLSSDNDPEGYDCEYDFDDEDTGCQDVGHVSKNIQIEAKENEKYVPTTSPLPAPRTAATQRIEKRSASESLQQFHCESCNFQTKVGKHFVSHRLTEHKINDPNIYACKLCTKRFSSKQSLYRHIEIDHKTLPDEKKFVCDECGKAYMRAAHLVEHRKQRHGPRRFRCADPDCEQTFTRAFTLRRHFLAAHTSETRYHCADCDKSFKIYDLWKYHQEIVHKNAIMYCPRCGYPFRLKEKLEEHLKKDLCKRSVIPCSHCQRKFTTKVGLKDHLKNKHKV